MINNIFVLKPSKYIYYGNLIEVNIKLEQLCNNVDQSKELFLSLNTLFEDDSLWVIDKPVGVVMHHGPGHLSGTIFDALLERIKVTEEKDNSNCILSVVNEMMHNYKFWPNLVHRLDRDTTGCLIMAKNVRSYINLQHQFKTRSVIKKYLALVKMSDKLFKCDSILIDKPIARHNANRLKMAIHNRGRCAQTFIKVLAKNNSVALLECKPLTGRTHQIRLHLSSLGSPIIGDRLYGDNSVQLSFEDQYNVYYSSIMLHAHSLTVTHPTNNIKMTFIAQIPVGYQKILDYLKFSIFYLIPLLYICNYYTL